MRDEMGNILLNTTSLGLLHHTYYSGGGGRRDGLASGVEDLNSLEYLHSQSEILAGMTTPSSFQGTKYFSISFLCLRLQKPRSYRLSMATTKKTPDLFVSVNFIWCPYPDLPLSVCKMLSFGYCPLHKK